MQGSAACGAIDFQAAFYENPVPLLICDRSTFHYLAVNRAATLLYGYTEEQMRAMTPFDVRPEGERSEFRNWLQTIGAEVEARRCSVHLRKNCLPVYVTTVSRPITWQGRRAYLIGVVDVAEQMDAAAMQMAHRRNYLEHDLALALEHAELCLHYQPIVAAQDANSIILVEALIRWIHPQLGLLFPADFIDIAESSGQIVKIGAWVLNETCRQLARCRQLHPTLRAAVNVSARQFGEGSLLDVVQGALAAANLEPTCLELEITETTALLGMVRANRVLCQLRDLGVATALDDFGTGYSSLSYLKHLPVTCVKIDKVFVDEIVSSEADRIIAEGVVGVAHRLGIRVAAEGVESASQADVLREIGVDALQGFHFGRPAEASALEQRLNAELSPQKTVRQ